MTFVFKVKLHYLCKNSYYFIFLQAEKMYPISEINLNLVITKFVFFFCIIKIIRYFKTNHFYKIIIIEHIFKYLKVINYHHNNKKFNITILIFHLYN